MNNMLNKANRLKEILVIRATSMDGDDAEYQALRREILQNSSIKHLLPECVVKCRSLQEFWGYISPRFSKYMERRTYLGEQFNPLLDILENQPSLPIEKTVNNALSKVSWETVHAAWQKALDRKVTDYMGTITASRYLVESVCKHILDKSNIDYTSRDDLPNLYTKAVECLSLSPTQQTNFILKKIMGGCMTTLIGLSELRNQESDAHGKGINHINKPQLGDLAINVAGTISAFLIEEFESQRIQNALDN